MTNEVTIPLGHHGHTSASSSKSFWSMFFGRDKLLEALSVDVRSVALFRIFVGFVLLFDLIERWGDLEAHYTSTGVFPARLASSFPSHAWYSLSFTLELRLGQLVAIVVAQRQLGLRH